MSAAVSPAVKRAMITPSRFTLRALLPSHRNVRRFGQF